MKSILTAFCFLLQLSLVFGQKDKEGTLFEAKSKTHLFYVELNNSDGKVFEMGSYLDKAGSGYSIKNKDTLTRKADGTAILYAGKRSKILLKNEKLYLLTQNKKTSKFKLDAIVHSGLVHTNLNNAYYLDHFFLMSDELNKTYPLYHYSFRNGFYTWKELNNHAIKYTAFEVFADNKLKEIKDSISELQNGYVSLTNTLIQKIKTIDYNSLKDSITKLPAEFKTSSGYFSAVIIEISKHRAELFFRLAEDFREKKNIIFNAIENDKQVIENLKAVENHTEIKKEFFKTRRIGKTMPYKIIGVYAVVIGLISFLIIRQ